MIAMAAAGSLQPALNAARPNIVLFLTDDQDQMLGSSFPTHGTATPMPKAQRLLADQGVTASNFFVHTPICCPSRNELLAGRYFHNIKTVPGDRPRPTKGDSCMHINETKVFNHTFARYLKEEAGYAVGLFGKFTNSWTGQWGRAPIGFDAWLANGGGDYMSPFFGVKGLKAFAGVTIATASGRATTTAVVGSISNAWIRHLHTTARRRPFSPMLLRRPRMNPSTRLLGTLIIGTRVGQKPSRVPTAFGMRASRAARITTVTSPHSR